eukprot:ANDGO_06487.mRNA.1 histidine kinase
MSNVDEGMISAFEEAKCDLVGLVRERSEILPREYAWASARCLDSLNDVMSLDTKMNASQRTDRHAYVCSLVLHATNDFLQALHDVAENRVIRGEALLDAEVKFISEINDYYYLLLNDVRPALSQGRPGSPGTGTFAGSADVFALPAETEQARIVDAREKPEASEGKESAVLRDEEIEAFETMYLHRVKEKLLRSGAVIEKKAFAGHPRFLFLSQYQLILTESLYIPKFSVDLSTIRTIIVKSSNILQIVTKDKQTFQLQTQEAESWLEDIQDAMTALQIYQGDDVASVESEIVEERYDVVVTILGMEDLRPNEKGRPDNPYFFVGVGNPEHYGQDRRNRQRSSTRTGTRSPSFNEQFFVQLVASREYVLDLRVYSAVKARQNFCYGLVQIPVEEIFVSESHCITETYDLLSGDSDKEGGGGRVKVSVKLQNWMHNRLPPARQIFVPALMSQKTFEIREKVPLILGKNKDIIAAIKDGKSKDETWLVDAVTKRRVYSLTKTSFFKKEFTVSDDKGPFARCFHKIKTFKKKKIRMYLMNGEWLFSMEGGSFDTKNYDNEVYIFNAAGLTVASLLFGVDSDSSNPERDGGRMLIVNMIDAASDPSLVLVFALYALRTL